MAGYFKQIIKLVSEDPQVKIGDIEIMTREERDGLLSSMNVKGILDRDETFSDLFIRQVRATPENVAVRHNEACLTYEELYTRGRQLAFVLNSKGEVQPDTNIAVFLPRSMDMLTGMIAIFLAGGVYVPVDIEFPLQRVIEMVLDSGVEIIITSSPAAAAMNELRSVIPGIKEVIYIDLPDEVSSPDQELIPGSTGTRKTTGDDLAYIIYTSGTTGRPKGVMIHQLGMVNHLHAMVDILNIGEKDRIAQTASPCFDISVWQFLVALIAGGQTCIIDKESLHDPARLMNELRSTGITIFQSVPSLLITLLDELPSMTNISLPMLRWMIPTGEPLPVSLVRKWYTFYPEIKLLNAYGPAEASDDVTTYVVKPVGEDDFAVPVGKPVLNMRVYILDDMLHLCPPGVKGEICISGPGVGRGYWRSPERTNAAFVHNPFRNNEDTDHDILYKTGDMGYYQSDGNIVCSGRKDNQVKIRGARIELGEIEHQLLQHGAIREVAVIQKEWSDSKYLVAYYTSEELLPVAELERFLSGKLPYYMIPAYFIEVKKLPLTPNGKVDRRALPDPEIRHEEEYVAPVNDTQKRVVSLWAEVLKVRQDRISIDGSFFYMGGHSLNTITLINKVYKEFNVKIPMKEFFMKPTVRAVADYVKGALSVA